MHRCCQVISDIESFMHANDLATVIPGNSILRTLPCILDAMHSFSQVSGLRLKVGKCAVFLHGYLPHTIPDLIQLLGLSKKKV